MESTFGGYTLAWKKTADGAHEIYLNARAWREENDVALRAFLRYIDSGEATDGFTRRLDGFVEEQKRAEEFKEMIDQFEMWKMDARREGYRRGKAEGDKALSRMAGKLSRKDERISRQDAEIARLMAEVAELKKAART